MSILKKEKEVFKTWGITGNPFRPEGPPSNPQQLTKIFHGRKREIELALPALYDGRNIMVRGTWGIGKTALIYKLLNRLAVEVYELEEQILILHIDGSPIATPIDFYHSLLMGITSELSNADNIASDLQQEAQTIATSLAGVLPPRRRPILEGKVNLAFISFGMKSDTTDIAVLPAISTNPYPLLATWLDHAQTHFSRLVIAVDDLDKKDTPVVQNILEGSLDLFRTGENRAFLMTGRGFTDLQEATLSSLGIFAEDIALEAMSPDDLRQIAINTLNTVRAIPKNDPHPFTEEVMGRITNYAQGNPRQLNTICDKVLRRAAAAQAPLLDIEHFESIWPQVQKETSRQLSPQLRKLLYVAYRANGISEDITNDQLDNLNALTFSELIPLLKTLEEKALLLRQEDEQGFRFLPSKLFLPDANDDTTT